MIKYNDSIRKFRECLATLTDTRLEESHCRDLPGYDEEYHLDIIGDARDALRDALQGVADDMLAEGGGLGREDITIQFETDEVLIEI